MKTDLLPYFDYIGTAKVRCKSCGAEMDTRGGRAAKHLEEHGTTLDKPADKEERVEKVTAIVAPEDTPEEASPLVRGSREWAVEKILNVMDGASTSEQVLKAADLLKEYQDFGTKRLDDEKEAEASALQWDRVFAKVTDLRKHEEKLLKDPSVRVRLKAALEAVK